jgi:acyl-CoA synthetase (AMP-forming)/AMP-acid ligase II
MLHRGDRGAGVNVGLAVTRSARRYGSRTAVFDDDREVSYSELEARSNRLANALTDGLGLERGSKIAFSSPNRIEVAEVMAGVAKAGMTYVGLNFRLSEQELVSIFENSQPAAVIVDGPSRELLEAVNADLGAPLIDLDDEGPQGYEQLLLEASDRPPDTLHSVWPDDDFCIVYTSGTTGTPKGVWFDHGRVLQHATVAVIEYEISAATRYLMAIPHNSSVNITLVPVLTMGGAIGFFESRGFDGLRYAEAVERHAATHSYLVPTQLYRLLDQLPKDSQALRSVVTLGYGAAPMAPERTREMVERFGPIFNQLYGMAEIASIGSILRKEDHVRALEHRPELFGSAGQPSYAVDTRVVNDAREDVSPGERGEVIFAGPHVMKGYYRDPERTAETLIDGWVHSGDIAEVDEEGYIYIVDRKKDLMIIGGHNVAPSEIEAVIHEHPDILEVGVIGVPSKEWGESILAVAALRPGATASAEEIQEWCRDNAQLPTVKTPERVELVDALPKNAIGKIAKNELRERYWTDARRV